MRGPDWSHVIPAGSPEFPFRFLPPYPVPFPLCPCTPKPGRLCVHRQLSVLGKGRGKYLFSPSSPPVQGCPVAEVTAGVCCDRDAAKHNQPWRLLFSAARGGGEQKTTFYFDIFILLLLEKCSLPLSMSCRSEPTSWLLALGFNGPLRHSWQRSLLLPAA